MNHLKRLDAPKKWAVKRKLTKYIVRPNPGAHSLKNGMPITILLRDLLNLADTTKEVKYIIHNNEVAVDCNKIKDHRYNIGLFDIINLNEGKNVYRIVMSGHKYGVLEVKKGEESIKPFKITDKTMIKKKVQLNLFDGKNITVDKDDYKVGDTIVIDMKDSKIKEHLKFEKGKLIYLTGGKHIGSLGTIEAISGRKIQYKTKEGTFETLKKYAFVIGKDKPVITVKKEK